MTRIVVNREPRPTGDGSRDDAVVPLQLQVEAECVVELSHDVRRDLTEYHIRRSTAIERTCSAWALESCRNPVAAAGSNAWNGKIRAVLLVTGTTVTTPRPSRAAIALARSLLTITAGRRRVGLAPPPGVQVDEPDLAVRHRR